MDDEDLTNLMLGIFIGAVIGNILFFIMVT